MNKFFLTVVLFLLTLAICAFSQVDQELLLRQAPIELQPLVHQPVAQRMGDFTHTYQYENVREILPGMYMPLEADGFKSPYNRWYLDDFSQAPFDGKIEIVAMGEPLPDTIITFCIMLAFAGIISWKRIRLQPT